MPFLTLNKRPKKRSKEKKSLQNDYQIATKNFEEDPTVSNQNRLNEAKEALELFYEGKGSVARTRRKKHKVFFKFRKTK